MSLYLSLVMIPIEALRILSDDDLKILMILEFGMQKFLYVPVDYVVENSDLSRNFILNSLKKMHDLGLLLYRRVPYEGYSLNYAGYDILALNFLTASNNIHKLNGVLGVGKESDVYMAFTPINEVVVLKFHRLGVVNLHNVRRIRGFLAEREKIHWIFMSKISAEREFKFLKIAYDIGVNVPVPIVQNRHVVVMSYVNGDLLYLCSFLGDPETFFNNVLDNIRLLYVEGGCVHGDLSEYNIIVTRDFEPVFIDWPQAVAVNDPSARMLLERDLRNIIRFFTKRFGLKLNFTNILSYIMNK